LPLPCSEWRSQPHPRLNYPHIGARL
jgi:hypothetical protein